MRARFQKWICTECGSDNVVSMAHAEWSTEDQRWILDDLCERPDVDYCSDCGDSRTIDLVDVTDLKTIAQITIKKGAANG